MHRSCVSPWLCRGQTGEICSRYVHFLSSDKEQVLYEHKISSVQKDLTANCEMRESGNEPLEIVLLIVSVQQRSITNTKWNIFILQID